MAMDRVVPVVERPGQYSDTFGSITKTLRDHGEPVTDEVLLSTKLKLYAGVEYLRPIDGDKHMVFFTGRGMAYNVDDAQIVAKRATDARVVVDVVATNGTAPPRLAGNGGNIPAPLISAPAGCSMPKAIFHAR